MKVDSPSVSVQDLISKQVEGPYQLVACTAQIVSAVLMSKPQDASELPKLIDQVFSQLSGLQNGAASDVHVLRPAVKIEDSITEDYIICLEDGKKFKMLKKHLMSVYGMTPNEYRRKWDLDPDYPMTAPSYAAKRQELAKKIGLGRKRG
ncbi:transcriptional regulator [Amylibacter marinus]|uniref:Transcriptional regulator n=1 Tax=Amylibacter marinus TaxID=1475483 RepID=A0ABQ5VRB2_9RHOB|nr:MucR family transcriptional regulator [Amylibacter marinus]GLQ33738.1 transcriptional regulator [Amylibacter marinus]